MKRYFKYFTLFAAALTTLVSCEEDVVTGGDLTPERLTAPTAFQAKFSATDPIDGNVTLSWGGSEGAESYTVALYSGNVDINSITPVVGENNCVRIDADLEEPTLCYTGLSTEVVTYYAYVQAISTKANVINSSWTTVYFSPKYSASVIPQATFATVVAGQTVTVQWTLDESVTPTEIVATAGDLEFSATLSAEDVENAEYVFEDLDPYTTYTFELVGEDSYGLTTALTYPIFELTAEQESEDKGQNMVVSWVNETTEFVTSYITALPVGGEDSNLTKITLEGTETSVTFTKLEQPNWSYVFTLYVDDIACGTQTAKTGENAPEVPVAGTAVGLGDDLAALVAAAEVDEVFVLADGVNTATVGEIVVDKNITIEAADGATPVLEGVYFTITNATLEMDGVVCQNTTGVNAFMTVGGDAASLVIKNSKLLDLTLDERLIEFTAITVKEFTLNNCVVSNIAAPSEVIDIAEAVEVLNIKNSTIANCNAGTTYFIDINGTAGDVTFDANTFVNQTNRGIRSRNKAYKSFVLTNNIYADFSGSGNRIIYSTSSDAPSTSTDNFAYGYEDNRLVKEGMTKLEAAPFSETPNADGIYVVTDGTAVGDPDGL
ncbi:MAG: hypothetical protein ACK5JS_04860 [Mangrovibacterium sp.]